MKIQKALVNAHYKLERFPGKGGWTYTRIPEIPQDKSNPFGWVKVKGSIDGYNIANYHLMPMGNGQLFLPVNSGIRKRIGKNAGDMVHVVLYADNDPLEIPAEMAECLKDEPRAFRFFNSLSEGEQNYYVKWIYSAKKEETRVQRLVTTVDRAARGLKFYDKP